MNWFDKFIYKLLPPNTLHESGKNMTETKTGTPEIKYDLDKKQVHISFKNQLGGAILPFHWIKETYKKIIKMEEIGVLPEETK